MSRRYNLTRHQSQMHPSKPKDIFADGLSSDEDSDEDMDKDEIGGKKAWDDLVKPVLNRYKDNLKDKCEDYEKDGISPEDAKRFASEDMYKIYKAEVILQYERLVKVMQQLEKSGQHQKIMRDVGLFENKGHPYEKALRLALRKNDGLFYEIIYADNDEETSEEDEEEEASDEAFDEAKAISDID